MKVKIRNYYLLVDLFKTLNRKRKIDNIVNNLKNKYITINDLYDWMEEHDKDPIVNSSITIEDQKDFVDSLDKTIINEDNFNFLSINNGKFSKKEEDYLIDKFVKFLNEKKYPNEYRKFKI